MLSNCIILFKPHNMPVLKKTKFHRVNLKLLISFIQRFLNWAAPNLATKRHPKGLYKMEGYYRETGGTRELLAKERKGLFSGQDTFWGGGGG